MQFGARETIERKITIEVAVQADETRIDQTRMQLDDEILNDLQNRRVDALDRRVQRICATVV